MKAIRIIHNSIKEKRLLNGFTQVGLAIKLKIPSTMLIRWEKQLYQPSKKYRPMLEKALGKNLFTYNDPNNEHPQRKSEKIR